MNTPKTPHYNAVRFIDIFPAFPKDILIHITASFKGETYVLTDPDGLQLPKDQSLAVFYVISIEPYYDEELERCGLSLHISDDIEIIEMPYCGSKEDDADGCD